MGCCLRNGKSFVRQQSLDRGVTDAAGAVKTHQHEEADSAEKPAQPILRQLIVYQHERWQPIRGFGSSFPGHLMPTDPGAWTTNDYQKSASTLIKLDGVRRAEDFKVIVDNATDEKGWQYAIDFYYFRRSGFSKIRGQTSFVRRRMWVEKRDNVDAAIAKGMSVDAQEPAAEEEPVGEQPISPTQPTDNSSVRRIVSFSGVLYSQDGDGIMMEMNSDTHNI